MACFSKFTTQVPNTHTVIDALASADFFSMGKFSGGLGEGSKSILYALITPKKILFFSKKDTTLYFSRKRSKNILFFPPRGRGLSSHQLPGLTGFLIRLQTNLAMFPFTNNNFTLFPWPQCFHSGSYQPPPSKILSWCAMSIWSL